jgi:uncharacterized protein
VNASEAYLPAGLPAPVPQPDGLDGPYWEGAARGELHVQRCTRCGTWQWGPEWICHACRSFDVGWQQVAPRGLVHSWTRVWHPVHPALKGHGPYLVVLVELPQAGGVRLLGNLLGDPAQPVRVGNAVEAVFERHAQAGETFTLVQWRPTR